MNQTLCKLEEVSVMVGPLQVYESIGHWNTAVLVILSLHLLPVWAVATTFLCRLSTSASSLPGLLFTSASLLTVPPALMTIATAGILAPSTGIIVEILHEIVISFGLVQFTELCVKLCDGPATVITFCDKNNVRLPIGSPPFVCLLPLRQPAISQINFNLMVAAPKLLLLFKSLILCVEITYLVVGYQPSGDFVSLDNIHNVIGIPVGLITIYFYTMFNFVMNNVMAGNSKRFIGVILLVEFILFDCSRLFFIFLTGTEMLSCVPPYLSQDLVVHLMKNYIKAFVATGLGLAMMNLVAQTDTERRPGSGVRTRSVPTSMSSLMSNVTSEDETK